MKTINNVQVWKDGEEKQANLLNAVLLNDDLATNANFYYQLLANQNNEIIISGSISMVGEDYQNWDDSNDGAYDYIANKLNLTIIS